MKKKKLILIPRKKHLRYSRKKSGGYFLHWESGYRKLIVWASLPITSIRTQKRDEKYVKVSESWENVEKDEGYGE